MLSYLHYVLVALLDLVKLALRPLLFIVPTERKNVLQLGWDNKFIEPFTGEDEEAAQKAWDEKHPEFRGKLEGDVVRDRRVPREFIGIENYTDKAITAVVIIDPSTPHVDTGTRVVNNEREAAAGLKLGLLGKLPSLILGLFGSTKTSSTTNYQLTRGTDWKVEQTKVLKAFRPTPGKRNEKPQLYLFHVDPNKGTSRFLEFLFEYDGTTRLYKQLPVRTSVPVKHKYKLTDEHFAYPGHVEKDIEFDPKSEALPQPRQLVPSTDQRPPYPIT